jgi:hypothetical protein
LCDAGAAFTRNFVSPGNVDHLDGKISEFTAEASCQVIASGFNQQDVRIKLRVQFFEREEIRRNILANCSMWAAARFDCSNSLGRKSIMPNQELAIFFREDVIGYRSDAHASAKMATELKHERSLPASNRPPNPNGKSAARKIAIERLVAVVKMAGMIQVFVRVAMISVVVRIRMSVRVHNLALEKS